MEHKSAIALISILRNQQDYLLKEVEIKNLLDYIDYLTNEEDNLETELDHIKWMMRQNDE